MNRTKGKFLSSLSFASFWTLQPRFLAKGPSHHTTPWTLVTTVTAAPPRAARACSLRRSTCAVSSSSASGLWTKGLSIRSRSRYVSLQFFEKRPRMWGAIREIAQRQSPLHHSTKKKSTRPPKVHSVYEHSQKTNSKYRDAAWARAVADLLRFQLVKAPRPRHRVPLLAFCELSLLILTMQSLSLSLSLSLSRYRSWRRLWSLSTWHSHQHRN